ncbi:MAG: nucleotidyltransferase family protein [Myxococcota bacterium]
MSEATESFTAVVLAGRRGPSDAFADALTAADAASHHSLLDVAGVPMLLRVVRALQLAPSVGRIVVSIDDPSVLEGVPELRACLVDGSLACRTALDSPSRSVLDALAAAEPDEKVLVVTADHALLTAEMVEHFTAEATGDLSLALVPAAVVRAGYPGSKRTFIRLRGGGYSGANLFAFCTPRARRAAEFWQRAEQFRKQPWKLARAFGPVSLLLFLARRLDLRAALERMSRSVGAQLTAVLMPWPEAAIDVDRPADLALVNAILAERARASGPRTAPPS